MTVFLFIPEEYESIFKYGSDDMQVNRVKFHNYIGMKLYYTTFGIVKINMLEYIEEIIDAFDKSDITGGGTKSSAAPAVILKFGKDFDNINAKQDVDFHHLVAKKYFATKQDRPETCTTVSFLTTRVRELDKNYLAKLVHLMKYIRGTRN